MHHDVIEEVTLNLNLTVSATFLHLDPCIAKTIEVVLQSTGRTYCPCTLGGVVFVVSYAIFASLDTCSGRVVGSSFTTRPEFSGSTFQPNPTRISKILQRPDTLRVEYSTRRGQPNGLTVGSGFGLTFWIRPDPKSGCSHFQPDSSRVEHISNPTRRDPSRNRVNPTRPAKDPILAPRGLKIETYTNFFARITFSHYLEGCSIGSHEESHKGNYKGNHEENHEGCSVGSHEGNHEESHEESHDQAIYNYLFGSGRVFGSGCRVQLYNPTRVLGSNFSTRPDPNPKIFQPDLTRSVHLPSTKRTSQSQRCFS